MFNRSSILRSRTGTAIGAGLLSLALMAPALAQDRLRDLVEPVEAKQPYRVGVTLVHFIDDYWKGIAYGLFDEAEHAGVEIVRLFEAGGYGNVSNQLSQLDTLASLNVDAVIIGAADFNGFDRAFRRLADQGIKVVAAGIPTNSGAVSLGVVMDDVEIGRAMAAYICNRNSEARVGTIPGPQGPAWNALRFQGFEAGAADCPGMTLYGNTFQGNTRIEDGVSQGTDLLVRHPDLDYIYAAAVSLGTGAAMAIRRADSDAAVVTATMTDRTDELMESGHIAMVVSEPGVLIGRLVMQYTTRLLNGDDMPGLQPSEAVPYPEFVIPVLELTTDMLADYDLSLYDQPPAEWQVPVW